MMEGLIREGLENVAELVGMAFSGLGSSFGGKGPMTSKYLEL